MDINLSSFIQFQKTIGDSESENHPLSNEPTPVILIIIVWAQLANIWPLKKLEIRKSTTILEKAKNRFFSKSARWMIFYYLVSTSYGQGDIRTTEKQWVLSFLTWRFRQTPKYLHTICLQLLDRCNLAAFFGQFWPVFF